jgi:MFS family permease
MTSVLMANTIILGIGLMVFSHISYFPLAMLFAAIFGFGAMAQTTICLTIVQVNTEPAMRGRVMSFLLMAMTGMFPIGSLITGAISQKIGAPDTLLCQGILALIIVAVFAKFPGVKMNNLRYQNQIKREGLEQNITFDPLNKL